MKNRRKLALILLFAGVLVIAGSVIFYFLSDRQKFLNEEESINKYITSLKAETEITNIKLERYCTYGHQKYSRGDLGCTVAYQFESIPSENYLNMVDARTAELTWTFIEDNSIVQIETKEGTPAKSQVYKQGELSCGIHVRNKNSTYAYYVGCSGPARAAWFPVKD